MNELKRSSTNRIFLGVCGGLGEYFKIDPTFIRILFLVFSFAGGASIILYFALSFIMPGDTDIQSDIRKRVRNVKDYLNKDNVNFAGSDGIQSRSGHSIGIIVVALGVYLLFRNFNLIPSINSDIFWPLLLIGFGLLVIMRRRITIMGVILIFIIILILSAAFSGPIIHPLF